MRPDLRTTPQHEFMQKSVNQNRKYESVGVWVQCLRRATTLMVMFFSMAVW